LTDSDPLQRAEAVRRFNRFYTQHIGALHESLQKSAFSLTEVRVLRELALGAVSTASELARNLGLDSGYLSRLLASFERRHLISRRQSDVDARQSLLALTDDGRAAYEPLDAAAIEEVSAVLARLNSGEQEQLIAAMRVVERLLDERPRRGTAQGPNPTIPQGDFLRGGPQCPKGTSFGAGDFLRGVPQGDFLRGVVMLRTPRAGDYGWLVHRQALLFGLEYGADTAFEAFVAQQVADFARQHDPRREVCWIAEQEQSIVGSAIVAAASETTAQLRLLYVEPEVRRFGIGARLIDEGVRFAQHAGYAKLTLSTCGGLNGAQRLYRRAGFACVATAPEERFGQGLVTQTWERRL
jgi:DNA-binding MarR family transcriptional regulator/GNAT superfamily N-acetyltransferase